MDDAPEDIRNAVRQLKFAYQRSAEIVSAPDSQSGLETQSEGQQSDEMTERLAEAVRRAEAILFAAGEPLSALDVAESLPPGVDAAEVLMTLKAAYEHRGVHLVEVAGKWRFQTASDLAFLFVEERQEQRKLSQAALETLAIIAYGQPVTRAEIEAVRGVAVSKGVVDTLMEAGWVKVKGRRQTPGRPVTFGTTAEFLEHFGLESLDVLPGKADLEAEGLLSNAIPEDFLEELEGESPQESTILDQEDTETAVFMSDFLADGEETTEEHGVD